MSMPPRSLPAQGLGISACAAVASLPTLGLRQRSTSHTANTASTSAATIHSVAEWVVT
ncbi:hypothetical protein [Hylemonella gracilis]|uniref:hypothetical protein n=1 Tax=Hylemonella gracilis TaxID=80880 RepID=UPI001ED91907|nr:hypothetical protein [Hylemonella gracilis]